MSQRAERAELEVQKLLTYIDELKALNEKLRNKIKPLEDYALLQIKHDHEINTGIDTIYDLKNKVLTDEERTEIDKLKNEPHELLQSLIKLKTENLELHNQLKDITIECNQQLREAKRK
jgi:predicted RNase H-like nuclease (RuvC/YqgF family)